MKECGLHINGEWIDSVGGETFESKNPTTGELLATFAKGAEEDVSTAISAAENAFPSWKRHPASKRGEIVLNAASITRERKEELGELVTKEMGKVIKEGKGDVQEAIDFLEYISGEWRKRSRYLGARNHGYRLSVSSRYFH